MRTHQQEAMTITATAATTIMMEDDAPRYTPAHIEALGPEDFETASIRSAAPSYTSDAPSYHSTVPNTEPVPPYSPRQNTAAPAPQVNSGGVSSLLGPEPASATRTPGLPPVPTGPLPQPSIFSLGQFRIPSWSNVSQNPTARHYHSVAMRRATAATEPTMGPVARRMILERIEEEERNRVRPLEDPHLVGEEAAARARAERLARENGDDILIREDMRWDFFLAQIKNQETRARGSGRFRGASDRRGVSRLAHRIGTRS